jgi:hypothetical protein
VEGVEDRLVEGEQVEREDHEQVVEVEGMGRGEGTLMPLVNHCQDEHYARECLDHDGLSQLAAHGFGYDQFQIVITLEEILGIRQLRLQES